MNPTLSFPLLQLGLSVQSHPCCAGDSLSRRSFRRIPRQGGIVRREENHREGPWLRFVGDGERPGWRVVVMPCARRRWLWVRSESLGRTAGRDR